jgi:hypothetical protein
LSPLDVRQLDDRDDQADRRVYLNALLGSRTIDGDNDDNNNDDNESDDAGERETISFFDQSVFSSSCFIFLHSLPKELFTDIFGVSLVS